MVTGAVSKAVPSARSASPFTCPNVGAIFHEKVGMGAGSLKIGVIPSGSYRTEPFTDLPVVRPDANSANGRAGVAPGGIAKGLLATAMLLVAMEKKMMPLKLVGPEAGVSVRRVCRSDPSIALTNAPWPSTPARLYRWLRSQASH